MNVKCKSWRTIMENNLMENNIARLIGENYL